MFPHLVAGISRQLVVPTIPARAVLRAIPHLLPPRSHRLGEAKSQMADDISNSKEPS